MSKVLRADDKRRNYHKAAAETPEGNGAAKRVSGVFHDRRHGGGHANGRAKRAK
jgi:hypothetical protein